MAASTLTFTEEQVKIIEHMGAPLRVLAGPGTGKTFCLIERIRHLVVEKKVSHDKISAITFTNATAGVLRGRLERSGIARDSLPYVNTLHGFAMGLLKRHLREVGLRPGFRPIDTGMQKIIVQDVVEDLRHDGVTIKPAEIKLYKDAHLQRKSKAGIHFHIGDNASRVRTLDGFSARYHQNLDFYNAIDWADVLHRAMELLDNKDDIRSEVKQSTEYLLVDEYQDLSPLEQEFVDKICGAPVGLCIAGDDDQCIYETFRFAAPEGIIAFPKKYSHAKMLYLTLCHRCPPDVVKIALKLISNNRKRVADKTLVASNPAKKGFAVALVQRSKKAEIDWLVSKVKELTVEKYKFPDIMVLFTDGKVAKDYVAALREAGIPLNVQLTVSNIFGTETFNRAIATVRWIVDSSDNLSTRQCLDYAEDIGTETIRQLRLLAQSLSVDLWSAIENVAVNVKAFKQMRQRNKVKDFHSFLDGLRKTKSFKSVMKLVASYIPGFEEDRGCIEMRDYFNKFDGQEDAVTMKEALESFEQEIDSGELENKFKQEGDKGVRIMSMHSAKGCEAPVVFLPALEDDIIPGEYTSNVEEKRRLFYVSLTRAKVGVYLTWARQRTGQEIHMHGRRMLDKKKSRFLEEIA